MMMNDGFAIVLVTTVLVNNVVLIQNLGVCPLFGPYKGPKAVNAMAISVFLITILSALLTWPFYHFLLKPLNLAYAETLSFVLLIAGLVQLTEILLSHFLPKLYDNLKAYLPLTATNCMILGLCEQNIYENYSFSVSMTYAFSTALSFWFAMFLFNAIRMRIDESAVPESFRGVPIYLISTAILSLAFLGLSGLAEGMFGMS